jgi:hypothetical protein
MLRSVSHPSRFLIAFLIPVASTGLVEGKARAALSPAPFLHQRPRRLLQMEPPGWTASSTAAVAVAVAVVVLISVVVAAPSKPWVRQAALVLDNRQPATGLDLDLEPPQQPAAVSRV